MPAAVRLPRASCSRCSCARDPSCAVFSAGICTSSIGRTRSMAPAQAGERALPGSGLIAILAQAFLPVEAPECVTDLRSVLVPCVSPLNWESVLCQLSFQLGLGSGPYKTCKTTPSLLQNHAYPHLAQFNKREMLSKADFAVLVAQELRLVPLNSIETQFGTSSIFVLMFGYRPFSPFCSVVFLARTFKEPPPKPTYIYISGTK